MERKVKIKDLKSFIIEGSLKFNNKFDYSNFTYINVKTKSVIICPIHGKFEQTIDKHMQSKFGCQICGLYKGVIKPPKEKRIPRISSEQIFLNKVKPFQDLGFSFMYNSFSNLKNTDIAVQCPLGHSLVVSAHLIMVSKHCCSICSVAHTKSMKLKTYEQYIQDANIKYSSKYLYPECNRISFVNRRSKIKILCPSHGEFEKSAQKHLTGQGCFKCKVESLIENRVLLGGYSPEYFNNNPDKKTTIGFVYYLKVGSLYKIGITSNLYNRLKSIKSESKKEITLIDSYETNLFDAYALEQKLFSMFKENRVYSNWSTEMFNIDILCNSKLHTFV